MANITLTPGLSVSVGVSLLIIDECVAGDTLISIKNSITNEITELTIEQLYTKLYDN